MLFSRTLSALLISSYFSSHLIASPDIHSDDALGVSDESQKRHASYPKYPLEWDRGLLDKNSFERLRDAQSAKDFRKKFELYASILEDEGSIPILQSRVVKDLGHEFSANYNNFGIARVFNPDELLSLANFTYGALVTVASNDQAPLPDRVGSLKCMLAFLQHSSCGSVNDVEPDYIYLSDKASKLRELRSIARNTGLTLHPSVLLDYINYLKKLVQYYIGYWTADQSYGDIAIEACEEAQGLITTDPAYRAGFKYYELCLRNMTGCEDNTRKRSLANDILKFSRSNEFKEYADTYLKIHDTWELLERLDEDFKEQATTRKKTKRTKPKITKKDVIEEIQGKLEFLQRGSQHCTQNALAGYLHYHFARLGIECLVSDIPLDLTKKKDIISSFAFVISEGSQEARIFMNSFLLANALKEMYFASVIPFHPLLSSSELKRHYDHYFRIDRLIDHLDTNRYVTNIFHPMSGNLKMVRLIQDERYDEAMRIAANTYEMVGGTVDEIDKNWEVVLNEISIKVMFIKNPSQEERLMVFNAAKKLVSRDLPLLSEMFLKSILVVYASTFSEEKFLEIQSEFFQWVVDLGFLSDHFNLTGYVKNLVLGTTVPHIDETFLSADIEQVERLNEEDSSKTQNVSTLEQGFEALSLDDTAVKTLNDQQSPTELKRDEIQLMPEEESLEQCQTSSSREQDADRLEEMSHAATSVPVVNTGKKSPNKYHKKVKGERHKNQEFGVHPKESDDLHVSVENPKLERYRREAKYILDQIKLGGRVRETEVFNALHKLQYDFPSTADEHFTWHRIHRTGKDKKGSSRNIQDRGRRQSLKEHLMRAIDGDRKEGRSEVRPSTCVGARHLKIVRNQRE